MDMKISGSGQIPSGEYEKIKISGSGHLHGFVRCSSFHSSGSSKGESIECAEEFHTSGSSKFEKDVRANSLNVSGSFHCGGNIMINEKISCSGSIRCDGNTKCSEFSSSGAFRSGGDIEAEKADISGKINCGGLLNAEEITIKFDTGMEIGSIGGSKIVIYREPKSKSGIRLPLLSSLLRSSSASASVLVKNSIEGDTIALENVVSPRVSGRIVAIGEGCEIDLVQYIEQVEISPKAKVGKTEKLDVSSC